MEYAFGIVLVGALAYTGVELAKHFFPTWYDKQNFENRSSLHDRMDELMDEIKKLTGGK